MTERTEETIKHIMKKLQENNALREQFLDILKPSEFVHRDEFKILLDEMKQQRLDFNKRFEAVDKRFEAVDKRFEAVDKRFEAVDKRFEEMIAVMKNGFTEMRDYIDARYEDISSRYGKRLEESIRRTAREILKDHNIDPNQVKHIQIVDKAGKYLKKSGITTDIDILYSDDTNWLIEIKSRTDEGTLFKLMDVKNLMEEDYQTPIGRLIVITLSIDDDTKVLAQELGIEIWHAISKNPIFQPPTPISNQK